MGRLRLLAICDLCMGEELQENYSLTLRPLVPEMIDRLIMFLMYTSHAVSGQ